MLEPPDVVPTQPVSAPAGSGLQAWNLRVARAQQNLANGDVEAALLFLDIHLATHPDDAEALALKGFALIQQGAIEDGDDLIRAYATPANSPLCTFILAQALLASGQPAQAADAFRAVARRVPDEPTPLLGLAMASHAMGDLAAAHAACMDALMMTPPDAQADALGLLGTIAIARGDWALAADALSQSTRQHPTESRLNNLGFACQKLDRLADAEEAFRAAVSCAPGQSRPLGNLGNILLAQGKRDEAEAAYRAAWAADPGSVDVLHNLCLFLRDCGQDGATEAERLLRAEVSRHPSSARLFLSHGAVLRQLGRREEALVSIAEALRLASDWAEAHNTMGLALLAGGQNELALEHFRRALETCPDDPVHRSLILNNLGTLLANMGQLDEGQRYLEEAVSLVPDYADGLANLGHLCFQKDDFEAAFGWFNQLVDAAPSNALGYFSRGLVLHSLQYLEEAEAEARKAIALVPDNALALNLLGLVLSDRRRLDESVPWLKKAALEATDGTAPVIFSNYLYTNIYRDDVEEAWLAAEHQRYEERYGGTEADLSRPHSNARDPGKRLKIGYVSSDFRKHSVAFFIEPILEGHDRTGFEVFCYSNVVRTDWFTDRIRGRSDHWRDIRGLGGQEVADQIRADGIDILIDLNGHTAHNSLPVFMFKPAPVQVTYLGYPSTTGLTAIDYRLTDRWADPPGAADEYSQEHLVRLPDCFHIYRPPTDRAPAVAPPPSKAGAPLTFGSFNNLMKVTPRVIAAWARILTGVPGSRLFLKAKQFESDVVKADVVAEFASHGIAEDRLILSAMIGNLSDHLARYGDIDLGLDTFPYHGTTTTLEALYMGVPVLSVSGNRHAARVGDSLLTAMGLDDILLAADVEDYVQRAVALAGTPDRLWALRADMRSRLLASALCQEDRFVSHMESAFRDMWQAWCDGPPTTARVPRIAQWMAGMERRPGFMVSV